MMTLVLTLAVVGLLVGFPDTVQARWLRRWLVERPAGALNRLRPGRLAFYVLLCLLGVVLTLLFEMEGLRLFGMMLPETLVWFAVFDVGVFVDALLISAAVLASNGLKVLRLQLDGFGRRVAVIVIRRTGRAPRPDRPKRPKPSSTDEDRSPWSAQPGYRAFSMA